MHLFIRVNYPLIGKCFCDTSFQERFLYKPFELQAHLVNCICCKVFEHIMVSRFSLEQNTITAVVLNGQISGTTSVNLKDPCFGYIIILSIPTLCLQVMRRFLLVKSTLYFRMTPTHSMNGQLVGNLISTS